MKDEGSKQSWIADGQTCERTDIFECRVTFATEESQLKIKKWYNSAANYRTWII